MIYPIEKLLPIIGTFSPTFKATGDTCGRLTIRGSGCSNCYLELGKTCGATFKNPDWQASLDQLKLTNPELFV